MLIILLLFGAHKLRKRCIKKRQRNSNSNEPSNNPHYNLNILPNQPPAQAHNYQQTTHHPHNPTYETVQHKHNPPQPSTTRNHTGTNAIQYNGNACTEQKRYEIFRVIAKKLCQNPSNLYLFYFGCQMCSPKILVKEIFGLKKFLGQKKMLG